MTESYRSNPIADSLEKIVKAKLSLLYTWAPGIVESYNDIDQTVDVRIVFKRLYNDADEAEEIAILKGVRIQYPGNEDFVVAMSAEPGTRVLLLFAMRSLDNHLTTGEVGDPGKNRMHSVSDAVAYLGFQTDLDILVPPAESGCIALRKKDNTVNLKVQNDKVTVDVGSTVLTIDASEVRSEIDIKSKKEVKAYNLIPLAPPFIPGYTTVTKHTHLDSLAGPTTEPVVDEPGPP